MKVRVLGCHGGVAPEYQTSCYYVNDRFLIDAGSICSVLTPQEQFAISDILITHPHIDHVKDICFLLENTFASNRSPVTLYSTPAILDDLHRHLFNDVLWPDFSKIHIGQDGQKPSLRFQPILSETTIGSVKIRPIQVNHMGNATGFILDDGKVQLIFSGDTGTCPQLWQEANRQSRLKAVFTEISFPNRMNKLAQASGHYTLALLMEDILEFDKQDVPIYISHFKPLFMKELLEEFYNKAPDRLRLMHENDEYQFS